MTPDRELLAERTASTLAHLERVAAHLVHAYGRLDLSRVHAIAQHGPHDLRAFLAALRDLALSS